VLTIDPSHQQVNPNTVEEHLFKTNSHHYGTGQASGGASTWDAVRKPEEHETNHLKPISSIKSNSSDDHRAYHGVISDTVSINNILGNEANNLTSNAPELGKHRSNNPDDPASRIDHHDPSTKEKFIGKVKVLFAKATGDQDMLSSGDALQKGHMERGNK
jgi:hypothetical protein